MYGRALEPTEILGHSRPVLLGYGLFSLFNESVAKSVDHRLKFLAKLRAAQLIGCEWCLDFGSKLAQDSGVPDADLRELSHWRDSERFDETDRLVLEYAEAMTRTPVEVADELFAALSERFDERQMVELTMTIGAENLYARTNWALGIEGEGFSDGMYCAVPDTAAGALVDGVGALTYLAIYRRSAPGSVSAIRSKRDGTAKQFASVGCGS
jgi:4-carboxymuconolactone decarboxylase